MAAATDDTAMADRFTANNVALFGPRSLRARGIHRDSYEDSHCRHTVGLDHVASSDFDRRRVRVDILLARQLHERIHRFVGRRTHDGTVRRQFSIP